MSGTKVADSKDTADGEASDHLDSPDRPGGRYSPREGFRRVTSDDGKKFEHGLRIMRSDSPEGWSEASVAASSKSAAKSMEGASFQVPKISSFQRVPSARIGDELLEQHVRQERNSRINTF